MKKYLIIILALIILSPYCINTKDLEFDWDNFIQQVFLHLDNCLDDSVKIRLSETEESDVNKEYILGTLSLNLSHKDYRRNSLCFRYIDTLAWNNDTLVNYFKDMTSRLKNPFEICYYRYLRGLDIEFENEIDSLFYWRRYRDSIRASWKVADTIMNWYIPKDLFDAFNQLEKLLNPDNLNKFKNYKDDEDAAMQEYFGIGLFIRNAWKLGGSRLQQYFANLGIRNHDRISVLILRAWYRHLHNKPLEFEELLEDSRQYETEL